MSFLGVALFPCPTKVDTLDRRQVFIVDEKKNYDESVAHCATLGGFLAPLHSAAVIKDVANKMITRCTPSSGSLVSNRETSFWRLGAVSSCGNTSWVDGRRYDEDAMTKLLTWGRPDHNEPCEAAFMIPYTSFWSGGTLGFNKCSVKQPFLCQAGSVAVHAGGPTAADLARPDCLPPTAAPPNTTAALTGNFTTGNFTEGNTTWATTTFIPRTRAPATTMLTTELPTTTEKPLAVPMFVFSAPMLWMMGNMLVLLAILVFLGRKVRNKYVAQRRRQMVGRDYRFPKYKNVGRNDHNRMGLPFVL